MELLIGVLLFLFILVTIIVNVLVRENKKKTKSMGLQVVPDLGIQKHSESFHTEMKKLLQHIDEAIPDHYLSQVRERVIREYQISQDDFENRWFEWKRYLAMVSILPNVPMYSREVDVVWHEMLMFTKDYEQFSKKLLGTTLHHQPHGPEAQQLIPSERGWFDLVFCLLFEPTKYTHYTWGTFLRNPVAPQLIHDFRNLTVEKLLNRYFNTYTASQFPVIEEIQKLLVMLVKQKVRTIDQFYVTHGNSVKKYKNLHSLKTTDQLLMSFLFLSVYHQEEFLVQQAILYKKLKSSDDDSGFIGCGASSDSDSGSNDSNSSDSGSDGGGSSCGSSCGGGGCGGSS